MKELSFFSTRIQGNQTVFYCILDTIAFPVKHMW
jgi:hypothetical protein